MPVSGLRACPQQGAAAEADGGGCLLWCGHGRGRPRGGPPSGAAAPWNAVPYGYTSLPAQCMRACPALDAGTALDRQQNTGGVGAAKFSLTAGAFAPIIERLTGCSAVGSALGSGPRGRGFKSPHSDQRASPYRTCLFLLPESFRCTELCIFRYPFLLLVEGLIPYYIAGGSI